MRQDKSGKKRPTFHPLVTAYVVVFFLAVGFVAYATTKGEGEFGFARAAGQFTGYVFMFIVPVVIAKSVSRTSKGVNMTASIVVSFLFIALFSSVAKQGQERREEEQAIAEFEAAADTGSLHELYSRSHAGEDVSQEVVDRAQRLADSANRLAKSGKPVYKASAIAAEITLDLSKYVQKQAELNHQYATSGGLDLAALHDESDFDKRIELLDQLMEETRALRDRYAGLESKILSSINEIGLSAYDKKEFMEGWRDGAQIDLAQKMITHELNLYAAHREIYFLLKKNGSAWVIHDDSSIEFTDTVISTIYDELALKADNEAELFESIQQQILKRATQKN